ncbi:MAG: LuxR C-terminal-related transcriptional regulator [Rhodospirillaceae bacterium]
MADVFGSLTLKQNVALQAILMGLSNAEVATLFDCADSTAKVHARGVMQKLGVRSRPHVILKVRPLFDVVDEATYQSLMGLPKDWATRPQVFPEATAKVRAKTRPAGK